MNLNGCLVALATPMTVEGQVDYTALTHLIEYHIAAKTDGIVLCGSTGEGATLDFLERKAIVEHAIDVNAGRLPLIAAVGTNSTATSITQAKELSRLAIQGLLMICPYYNRPTQLGLIQHFTAIANANVAPIILYNHPGRTGVDLLPETVAALAKINGIIGLKEAVTDTTRFVALRQHTPVDFLLYSGDDATCSEFIRHGAQGVISVAANVVPDKMRHLIHAVLEGDHKTADKLQEYLMPLFNALGLESNPIPLKYTMSIMGLADNNLRLPLTQLSERHQKTVDQVILDLGIKA